jgi:tetratricopeptide (TPR) repeat protein
LAALPGSLPKDIAGLLAKCLTLEATARYSDWGELESALGTAWETITDGELPDEEAAQELNREERVAVGWSYSNMGGSYLDIGKADVAREYFERARDVGQSEDERHLEGAALGNLGNAYAALGDARRAIGYYEQALEISREIGDRRGEGADLGNLGNAYADLGDARQAIGYYEQALVIRREIGDTRGVATVSFNMALLYHQQDDNERALPLAQEAAAAFARIGHPEYTQRAQQLIAQLQGDTSPGGEAPASAQADPVQAAFEAFQRAGTSQEMQAVVSQHPLMTDDGFIQAIEQVIEEQVRPEHRPAFQERLDWLQQIREEQE